MPENQSNAYMNIRIQKLQTPNFILEDVHSTRPRHEGFNPNAGRKWHVSEVDAQTLAQLCDDFRADLFRKAGKEDPANPTSRA